MASWDYSHRALIAGIDHSKPHDNVAWEIFYPEGPFALLPMLDGPDGQHRSALVWTCLLYTSPSPRDRQKTRMPSSA